METAHLSNHSETDVDISACSSNCAQFLQKGSPSRPAHGKTAKEEVNFIFSWLLFFFYFPPSCSLSLIYLFISFSAMAHSFLSIVKGVAYTAIFIIIQIAHFFYKPTIPSLFKVLHKDLPMKPLAPTSIGLHVICQPRSQHSPTSSWYLSIFLSWAALNVFFLWNC